MVEVYSTSIYEASILSKLLLVPEELLHWRHYFFLLHVDNADRKRPQYEKARGASLGLEH